jgi:hypothetical protein
MTGLSFLLGMAGFRSSSAYWNWPPTTHRAAVAHGVTARRRGTLARKSTVVEDWLLLVLAQELLGVNRLRGRGPERGPSLLLNGNRARMLQHDEAVLWLLLAPPSVAAAILAE